jgi:hypothetical protein
LKYEDADLDQFTNNDVGTMTTWLVIVTAAIAVDWYRLSLMRYHHRRHHRMVVVIISCSRYPFRYR